jgi:hypothetical protein
LFFKFFKKNSEKTSRSDKAKVNAPSEEDDVARTDTQEGQEDLSTKKSYSDPHPEQKLGLDNTHEEALSDISREHRDRKAVKADDAEVPKYLWEEHLLEGLEDQEWDDTKLFKIRKLSEWLRSKMWRWWTHNVTKSYIYWAETKYDLEDVKNKVAWVTWNGVGYEWSQSEGSERWAKAEGPKNYRSWWKRRLLITHQDAIPAGDAIRRAAKSSWWAWDAGSRPFNWRWP